MKVGDKVRIKENSFPYVEEYGGVGIVQTADAPIAKYEELGYEYCGLMIVQYPNGYELSTHASNFELVEEG